MKKDLTQLEIGDLVVNTDGYYRRVLSTLPNAGGELRVYILSLTGVDETDQRPERACGTYTAYDLREEGYSHVDLSDTVEVLGKKYNRTELDERLKELKPVE